MKALIVSLLAILPLAAAPKIATVDLDEVFVSYHRTAAINREFAAKEKALQESPRFQAVKQSDEALKKLAGTIRDTKLSKADREAAAKEFESVNLEYQSLVAEFQDFLREEQGKIRKEQLDKLDELIVQIRQTISVVAAAGEFDLVLETGGDTSSQVPSVIYLRDGEDITSDVIAKLNEDAPAETTEEEAAEAPEEDGN